MIKILLTVALFATSLVGQDRYQSGRHFHRHSGRHHYPQQRYDPIIHRAVPVCPPRRPGIVIPLPHNRIVRIVIVPVRTVPVTTVPVRSVGCNPIRSR